MRVIRSAERFTTQTAWSLTRHSFSFGGHYDPSNTHFGLLIAHNDEVVLPGAGYQPHPHRDIEIVSWVIAGVLRHEDGAGNVGETASAQLLSAGTGVTHSERSANEEPVHFIQMWIQAAAAGQPEYQRADIEPQPDTLTPVASGSSDAPLRLRQPAATLFVGRGDFAVSSAAFVHLFVTRGRLTVGGAELDAGDAARINGRAPFEVHSADAEALVWQMGAAPRS